MNCRRWLSGTYLLLRFPASDAHTLNELPQMAVFEAFGGKVGEGEATLNTDKLASVLEE